MSYFDMGAPWPVRAANRWGHWGARLLVVSVLGAIGLALRPPPPGSPVALEAPLVLLLLVVMSWYFMRQHDRRLCESCMSALPLNASEEAARFRRRLSVAHLASRWPITAGYLVLLVVSSPILLTTDVLPFAVARALWAAIQSTMIYLVLSYTTHRRLQPWCRQCRGGDGSHDADAPDPVPTGSHTA